jgi:hypothetical protein
MNRGPGFHEDRPGKKVRLDQASLVQSAAPACDAAMKRLDHRHFPDDSQHLSLLPLDSEAGPERQWRQRRNMVMYLINRHGVPYQLLADAFELGIVQVRTIINELAGIDRSPGKRRSVLNGATRRLLGKAASSGTPLQRWRARRNAVIRFAAHLGLPRELIADVFELRRTGLGLILSETAADTDRYRHRQRHRKQTDAGPVKRKG